MLALTSSQPECSASQNECPFRVEVYFALAYVLSPVDITPELAVGVGRLHGLRSLSLLTMGEEVHSTLTQQLAQLHKLESLAVDHNSDTGRPLIISPQLTQLQQLTTLTLTNTTTDCLLTLRGLSRLQSLDLSQGSYGLPIECQGLSSLRHLTLFSVDLVKPMSALSHLGLRVLHVSVHVSVIEGVSHHEDAVHRAADLSWIVSSLTKLTDLFICNRFPDGTDICIPALVRLSRLQSLQLQWGQHSFRCSSAWCLLRSLRLAYNCLSCMSANLTVLTALQELDVSRQTVNFQVKGPLDFLDHMPALRVLNLKQMFTSNSGRADSRHKWGSESSYYLIEAQQKLEKAACAELSLTY